MREQKVDGWQLAELPGTSRSSSFVLERTKLHKPCPSSRVFRVPHQWNELVDVSLILYFKLQSKGNAFAPSISSIEVSTSSLRSQSASTLLLLLLSYKLSSSFADWSDFIEVFSIFSSKPSRAVKSLHSGAFTCEVRFGFLRGEHRKGFFRFSTVWPRPSWTWPLIGFRAFEIRKDGLCVDFFFLTFNLITPEGFTSRLSPDFGEVWAIFEDFSRYFST